MNEATLIPKPTALQHSPASGLVLRILGSDTDCFLTNLAGVPISFLEV